MVWTSSLHSDVDPPNPAARGMEERCGRCLDVIRAFGGSCRRMASVLSGGRPVTLRRMAASAPATTSATCAMHASP